MGRWSHLDTDDERLPEGMARVGYDADTQVYTYRDSDGSYWEGAPGCQYGKLQRVSCAPPLPSINVDDVGGEEPLYVLHDGDFDSDSDGDRTCVDVDDGYSYSSTGGQDKEILAGPTKARLRRRATSHPHSQPRPGKTLPSLPGEKQTEAAEREKKHSRSSSNSYFNQRRHPSSDISGGYDDDDDDDDDYDDYSRSGHLDEKQGAPQPPPHGLKRAGTLSRLTGLVSRSRRAVLGRAATTGSSKPRGTAAESGPGQQRRRSDGEGGPRSAKTFDEILGLRGGPSS